MTAHQARIPPEVQERVKDGAVGPYRIQKVIGAGGMGAVFLCHDKKLGREVAVKVLLAPSDERATQRFLSEARILAKVCHPNIVQIYDVGYDGHVPYFVMEHVIGDPISTRLERLVRMPIEECRDVTAQVARGLAAVHALGIIHRDVKAANVIVREDGIVKLVDFGIARPVEHAPKLTSAGLVMGTPSSMAPEQLRGEELDQRADVYALGVLLYQMLTGERPYEGDDPATLASMMDKTPPKPIQEARPDCAEDLRRVVGKALAQSKENRYWNCEELLKDVELPASSRDLSLASNAATKRNARVTARYGIAAVVAALSIFGFVRAASKGCIRCEPPVAGAEGRPRIEKTPTAVFLWHDGTGWHVRARSAAEARELSGTLKAAGGYIENVRGIDGPSSDAISVEGRRLARFRFDDAGSAAGFDFTLTGGCLEVNVTSADVAAPELVRVGATGKQPATLPMRFCM